MRLELLTRHLRTKMRPPRLNMALKGPQTQTNPHGETANMKTTRVTYQTTRTYTDTPRRGPEETVTVGGGGQHTTIQRHMRAADMQRGAQGMKTAGADMGGAGITTTPGTGTATTPVIAGTATTPVIAGTATNPLTAGTAPTGIDAARREDTAGTERTVALNGDTAGTPMNRTGSTDEIPPGTAGGAGTGIGTVTHPGGKRKKGNTQRPSSACISCTTTLGASWRKPI